MKVSRIAVASSLVMTVMAGPVLASAPLVGEVVVQVSTRPTSPLAAQRLVTRLENAALDACGAPPTSTVPVRRAAKRSACWQDAMARAVSHIGDPLVAEAFVAGNRS